MKNIISNLSLILIEYITEKFFDILEKYYGVCITLIIVTMVLVLVWVVDELIKSNDF